MFVFNMMRYSNSSSRKRLALGALTIVANEKSSSTGADDESGELNFLKRFWSSDNGRGTEACSTNRRKIDEFCCLKYLIAANFAESYSQN